MFLVDTNVWLELLLEQDKAEEVKRFLQNIEARFLAITEFSLYSIGIILTRLKMSDIFVDFLSDTIEDSAIAKVCLDTNDLKQVIIACKQFNLDFDDAYQYVAATKYGWTLVSFDSNFVNTQLGRKTPGDIVN